MMTELLHRLPDEDPFANRIQRARQRYLAGSEALQRSIAENYVGLPIG
jgi:p-hydroxybenzoate 3-monooxygenase